MEHTTKEVNTVTKDVEEMLSKKQMAISAGEWHKTEEHVKDGGYEIHLLQQQISEMKEGKTVQILKQCHNTA